MSRKFIDTSEDDPFSGGLVTDEHLKANLRKKRENATDHESTRLPDPTEFFPALA